MTGVHALGGFGRPRAVLDVAGVDGAAGHSHAVFAARGPPARFLLVAKTHTSTRRPRRMDKPSCSKVSEGNTTVEPFAGVASKEASRTDGKKRVPARPICGRWVAARHLTPPRAAAVEVAPRRRE